jgi:hypothetical protein
MIPRQAERAWLLPLEGNDADRIPIAKDVSSFVLNLAQKVQSVVNLYSAGSGVFGQAVYRNSTGSPN